MAGLPYGGAKFMVLVAKAVTLNREVRLFHTAWISSSLSEYEYTKGRVQDGLYILLRAYPRSQLNYLLVVIERWQ
jgi:type IV secretory pathway ATPase VirB11/archaellum biosynthesis ATPase